MAGKVSIDSEIDWVSLPRDEAIALAMDLFNFDKAEARFYVSIARSEISGDVVNTDTASDKEKEVFGL